MNRVPFFQSLALTALLLPFGAGCATTQKGAEGIQTVDGLVGNVERVHMESEVSLDRAREGVDALRAILRHDFQGDPSKAYIALEKSIANSEAQTKRFADSVPALDLAAQEVFANWTRDIETMTSAGLREKSEARRKLTEERYQAVVKTIDPIKVALERFNLILRDHALFLGHDFNAEAISVLGGEMETLRKQYEALAVRVERLGDASREYMRTSAPLTTLHATPQGSR